jgi:hypothetical protein
MPRARHTDLIARRDEDVRTLAVSPRGKAAGDEIMHKDAAGHDRGPERHLASERVSTITSPMALTARRLIRTRPSDSYEVDNEWAD